MGKKVYIRADGGAEIGLGHLVRCLALAQMLQEDFIVSFFSQEIPEKLKEEIELNGFLVNYLNSEAEFFKLLNGSEIVVLDHYGLDSSYQKRIKNIGCRLICIDDLHDKEFFADIIINHAPGIVPEDYKARLYTQFALGLNFALLRQQFLSAISSGNNSRENASIIICFGGSDKKNLTRRTLQVVLDKGWFENIYVVVGAGYREYLDLEKFARSNDRIILHKSLDAEDMSLLMKKVEAAVVPASGILIEALAMGLKVISGKYVHNQQLLYKNYKKEEAFIDANDFSEESLRKALDEVIKIKDRDITQMIDGKSRLRIRKLFKMVELEREIILREANEEDLKMTFQWAVDPEVRRYSFSKDKITFEDHKSWFRKKIQDRNCYYFIAVWNDNICGSVRFDLEKEQGIISYLVDPQFHGNGIGQILVKIGTETLNKINSSAKTVIGFVLNKNIASIKTFQRLGFSSEFLEKEKRWKFYKNLKETDENWK